MIGFDIGCAVLSASVYQAGRPTENRTPPPHGAQEIKHYADTLTGFEASAYSYQGKIVIAFAGTNTDEISDIWADISLGSGNASAQMKQAAKFYYDIKSKYGDNVTFTGHSLGGGLASLMGVLFNKPTVAFDPAPFRMAATTANAEAVRDYLINVGYAAQVSSDTALQSYTTTEKTVAEIRPDLIPALVALGLLGGSIGSAAAINLATKHFPIEIPRESNVTVYAVKGEFLTNGYNGLGASLENALRIKSTPQPVIIDINPPEVSGLDLHSQALLISALVSPDIESIIKHHPDVAKIIFDEALYKRNASEDQTDFLNRLLQIEFGTQNGREGHIKNFTTDLGRLLLSEQTQGGFISGSTVRRSLIVAAMDYYYLNDFSNNSNLFFSLEAGGLHFSYKSIGVELTKTKSVTPLSNIVWSITEEAGVHAEKAAKSATSWHIQAGAAGLAWQATNSENSVAIGGAAKDYLTGGGGDDLLIGMGGVDVLNGGDGSDVLVGGDGADQLSGGRGTDTLFGGEGSDSYQAEEGDTIIDSDGLGRVELSGRTLGMAKRAAGDTVYRDAQGNTFSLSNGTLTINDPSTEDGVLIIKSFTNGQLGIYLDDAEDPSDPKKTPKPPAYNPQRSRATLDPLVLDLNGNGQIDAISSTASTAYFDFDGNGTSERSGWIASQDGLLALDSNANGVIDGLDELFGSRTVDGFTELAEHDTNRDGTIDADDHDFTKLRVWQDANQDGISQANELKTLDDLGITSLSLQATAVSQAAGDNHITAVSTFTRNGQTFLSADIELAVNFAITEADPSRPLGLPVQLDESVFSLPWLRGYGDVKSLPVAYQADPSLVSKATELINQDWLGILRDFESFAVQWTGLTQAHADRGIARTNLTVEDKVWMLESLTGQNTDRQKIETANFGSLNLGSRVVWIPAYINQQWDSFVLREAMSFAIQSSGLFKGASYSLNQDRFIATDSELLFSSTLDTLKSANDEVAAAFAAVALSWLRRDGITLDSAALKAGLQGSTFAVLFGHVLDSASTSLYGQVGDSGVFSIDTGIGRVVWGSGSQKILQGTSSNDVLIGNVGNDTLSGLDGDDTYVFGIGYGQDVINESASTVGGGDTLRLMEDISPQNISVTRDATNLYIGINGTQDRLTIKGWFESQARQIEHVTFADGTQWSQADLLDQLETTDPTSAGDSLHGREAGDTINGLGGGDVIYGYGGNDALSGGDDSDALYGHDGDDTLSGDAGSDVLVGGRGSDVYLFGLGQGADTIREESLVGADVDTILLGTNIDPEDLTVSRDEFNLRIQIKNSSDSIVVENWYSPLGNRIERLEFANGVVWDAAALDALVNTATENADYLYGTTVDDVMDGLAGNDTIFGLASNDSIRGGAGRDSLVGGDGDDTLDGGAETDGLAGGNGSDTYVFGAGSGWDWVDNRDTNPASTDTIRMAAGIDPEDVTVTQDAYDLHLILPGSTDRITIRSWFSGAAYRIDQVVFENGTVWDAAYLMEQANTPTQGNDHWKGTSAGDTVDGLDGHDALFGQEGNDLLQGGAGNDSLMGGDGNDILDGQAGNDLLDGGLGNDTFRFGLGDGQDTLQLSDSTANKHDAIELKTGIAPTDVTLRRYNNDLILRIGSTEPVDQLTIRDFFRDNESTSMFGIDSIRFADNTTWTRSDMHELVRQASEGDDSLIGAAESDTLSGLGGRDLIRGEDGQDELNGGAGNDLIFGGEGHDTLIGDAGDDYLDGGAGNDTYRFGLGDGRDVIGYYESGSGGQDIIELASGIATSDVTVLRQGDDLILRINGTENQLTVSRHFFNEFDSRYGVAQIHFADNTIWDVDAIRLKSLVATQGNDSLIGSEANDTLSGLGGHDYLEGRAGHDSLAGNAGNDTLNGGAGDDTLHGGAGNDLLDGSSGDDTYLFGVGDGQDYIHSAVAGTGQHDVVQFLAGVNPSNVKLSRQGNTLVINVGNGQDSLTIANYFSGSGGPNSDVIEFLQFEDGPSWSYADVLAKLTTGTAGSDSLYAGSLGDTLNGQDGNDLLEGNVGNDSLIGGEGHDTLRGSFGDDTLQGGTGQDLLDGGSGNDTYVFGLGDGQDTVQSYDSNTAKTDIITLGAGISPELVEVRRNSAGDLVLSITGTQDALTVKGFFSITEGFNPFGIEAIVFDNGTQWTVADVQVRLPGASSGNDTLYGYAAADTLHGLAGNDLIFGGAGADHLIGDAGNDALDGGAGDDTYVFGLGDGQDIINGYELREGKQDILQFKPGIAPEDIQVRRIQDNLVLSIEGTQDSVTIIGQFAKSNGLRPYGIDAFVFDDATRWTIADIYSRIPGATTGNDSLFGDDASESFQGLAGNDSIASGAGNDTLDGGLGNDTLDGGAGDDTYVFGLGDGKDAIYSLEWRAGKQDVLHFKADIAPNDIRVARYRDDLIISIAGTQDQITISNQFYQYDNQHPHGVDAFVFEDGTHWSLLDIYSLLPGPTDGNDQLSGDSADDLITALGGNDQIFAGAGNDTLHGGAGGDTLDGGDGDDRLEGGEGNDQLTGGNGDDTYMFGIGDGQDTINGYEYRQDKQDTLRFKAGVTPGSIEVTRSWNDLILTISGTQDRVTISSHFTKIDGRTPSGVEAIVFDDGTSWTRSDILALIPGATAGNDMLIGDEANDNLQGLAGNDSISAGSGNDTLEGGAGNDWLDGGAGDDTYVFGSGDGQDTIYSYESRQGKQDVLRFKAGIAPESIEVTRSQNDLILTIAGTQDSITLFSQFAKDNGTTPHGVNTFIFDDGTQWTLADVRSRIPGATNGNDQLFGDETADSLQGIQGNDLLSGGDGNDTLDGGLGSDTLIGGAGDDTYVFGFGDGQDTINSEDSRAGKQDVLRFKSDVTSTDVQFTRSADDLIVTISGTQDRVTIKSQFTKVNGTRPYGVNSFVFEDGTSWSLADVSTRLPSATAGDDVLFGTDANDSLQALEGNDSLDTGDGNDTLDGGAGHDRMDGGAGDDTYVFGLGDGHDTINSYENRDGKLDVLQFKSNIGPNDIEFIRSRDDLIVHVVGTENRITLIGQFSLSANKSIYGVDVFAFEDGTRWSMADVHTRLKGATEGDDTVSGGSTDDLLDALGGNDHLFGVAGNDTLIAGAGNDYMDGGDGDDTYIFGMGDGQDTISSQEYRQGKQDVLRIKSGISPEAVQLIRDGNNLVVSISGTQDSITINGQFWLSYGYRANGIDAIHFEDGTHWTLADIYSRIPGPTEGDDRLYGDEANDLITAIAGDDTIVAGAGNDTLDGGAGDDNLNGDAGDDVYLFGSGDGRDQIWDWEDRDGQLDTLSFKTGIAPESVHLVRRGDDLIIYVNGSQDRITVSHHFQLQDGKRRFGIEAIAFDDGTTWNFADIESKWSYASPYGDQLVGTDEADTIDGLGGADNLSGRGGNDLLLGGAGNDDLSGEAGNDTLDGGEGRDWLNGGDGDDTYLFGAGDGQDTIWSSESRSGKMDVLRFKDGISAQMVSVHRRDTDLFLKLNGSDELTISGYFASLSDASANVIDQIQFADGTVWGAAEISNQLNHTATAGDDELSGSITGDVMDGLGGNDTISGHEGDDHLLGGSGDDMLFGGDGVDTLDGGQGNDALYGGGYYGNGDVYVYGRNQGNDTIYAQGLNDEAVDQLLFDADVLPGDVTLTREGYRLVIAIQGSEGTLTIDDYYFPAYPNGSVEEIKFANGTVWDYSIVNQMAPDPTLVNEYIAGDANDNVLSGGQGSDTIFGQEGNDHIDGGSDADILFGDDGDDTLDGGTGNDYLYGGSGNDTFLFNRGAGQDQIITWDVDLSKLDVVVMGTSISPDDVIVTRPDGNNTLVLKIRDSDDQLIIENYFSQDATSGAQVDEIRLQDGTVWSVSDVLLLALTPTSGTDVLVGYNTADFIDGSGGDDLLFGSGGDDTLQGGAGNDVLLGGDGNDTYLFGLGSGADTISSYDMGSGKIDTLQLGTGIKPSDINVELSSGSIKLSIQSTNDSVVIQGTPYDIPANSPQIDQIRFANGAVVSIADLLAGNLPPDDNDILLGSAGADSLDAGVGDDVIHGYGGADTIEGGVGADTMYGGAGDDLYYVDESGDLVIEGSDTGNDTVDTTLSDYILPDHVENLIMNGKAEVNSASGNDLDNYIVGTWIDAQINGLAGNDTITSYDGNDTLDGGLGYDILEGGTGNDIYYVDQTLMSDDEYRTDEVLEFDGSNGGIDTVYTEIGDYVLPSHVENLVMTGKSAYGNELDNHITGSGDTNQIDAGAGHDTLIGLDGDDWLIGGEGNDVYVGGGGDDTLVDDAGDDHYTWGRGEGADSISDGGGTDKLHILDGVSADQIWLRQNGQALELQVIGTYDRVLIDGWFIDPLYQIESFELADGKTLNASNVQALVSAMAGFTPPPMGQTTLTQQQQAQLGQVIASNWS